MIQKIACLIASLLALPCYIFAQEVPLLGVCANLDKSAVVNKYDYAFIQPTVSDALQPLQADSIFNNGEKIKKSDVKVLAANVFIPGSIKTTGPEVNEQRIIAYATTVFKRAQSQGIPIIVFGSGASRMIPEGFSKDSAFKQFVSIGKSWHP
ncbi:hypothetical protein [Niabella hibiscisoli]|uniref:hypothetical protein n=1 Tax=Niabella hibiscisoli TaxID=1825928 RepID=UPI001F107707|nr:hypothetical protein [Niabella hibiscisoli]MCH5721374.1 hypothetical protein [Niabella hibiscisoli]